LNNQPALSSDQPFKILKEELPKTTSHKFPQDFKAPIAWKELVEYSLNNEFMRYIIEYDLNHRHVQTNVLARYRAQHIPVTLLKNRLFPGEKIRWLDVGPSIGLGPRAEISGHNLGHASVSRQIPSLQDSGYEYLHDARLSNRIRKPLDSRIEYERIIGADVSKFDSPLDILWVRGSYYTSELLNKGIMRDFDKLSMIEDPRLDTSHLVNFASPSSVSEFSDEVPRKYHIITALTVKNQLKESDRQVFDENIHRMLEPNGVYIESDFEFEDMSVPYSYRTKITIPSISPQAFDFMWWENGRCRSLILPPNNGDAPFRLDELLKEF